MAVKYEKIEIIQHQSSPRHNNSFQGLFLVALSAFCFSVMSLLVKVANQNGTGLSPLSLVMFRGLVSFTFNLIYSIGCLKTPTTSMGNAPGRHCCVRVMSRYLGLDLTRTQQCALLGRCISGTISIASGYVAMTLLPLGDASSLIFTSPIVTFLLARVFLKEHIDRLDVSCAFVCFIGVAFVARPSFLFVNESRASISNVTANGVANDAQRSLGILTALLAALASATAYVCVRKLGDVPADTVVGAFMCSAFLFGGLTALVTGSWTNADSFLEFGCIFGIGLTGFGGQRLMTLGFALEKAGPAAVMRYIDVLFAFIWSATFLKENINPWSVFGGAIIMISAVIITWNKKLKNQKIEGENRGIDGATIDDTGEEKGEGEEGGTEDDEEQDGGGNTDTDTDTDSEGSFEI